MYNLLKLSLLIILSFTICSTVNAQNKNISTTATLGLSTPILDGGSGVHIGINPSYALSSRFSMEGQVSYQYSTIRSSFLSGDDGNRNSINTLVGGRFYISSAEKANRLYVNLLIGTNYNQEETNGLKDDGELTLGLSTGLYYTLNKFLIGLAVETPDDYMLKIGYTF